MLDSFFHFLEKTGLTAENAGVFALAFVASFAASLAIVVFLAVRMPRDYFAGPKPPHLPMPLWERVLVLVLKNLLGIGLIALGIVLSLPGVPGQGFLTILIGIMLVDGPGKRRLEMAIIRRPAIRGAINRLRKRFGKEELVVAER